MLNTLWAVVQKEKIELLEKANIPEGTKVLVTVLPDDNESQFWLKTSQISLDAIWNNSEDDVYAELLKGVWPQYYVVIISK
jgi:hypothetical protein